MRFRSTYLLIAVLLLVVAGIVGQRFREYRRLQALEQRKTQVAIPDPSAVDNIELKQKDNSLRLVKTGGKWFIASDNNFPADATIIDRMLDDLSQVQVRSVAGNAKDLAAMKLDPGQRIELTLTGDDLVIRAWWLSRGDDRDGTSFLMDAQSDVVFVVEPIPNDVFTRTDWRDKAIIRVPEQDIQEIKYRRGREQFTLARTNGQWELDGKPANQQAADLLASNIANLNVVEFLPPDTTFTPLNIVIGLTLKDRQMELALGKAPNADEAYLKTDDGKMYLLANTNRARLEKTRKEFAP
ncbi:MAG: DUF4340 domain-containing protein [bacterium]|nr:DUF4340 domain-containing protein [bacterium]